VEPADEPMEGEKKPAVDAGDADLGEQIRQRIKSTIRLIE
tara:strand:- start:2042 stop:2161 length:120 start_codon:yes stop_codon:yes gene_type:complete